MSKQIRSVMLVSGVVVVSAGIVAILFSRLTSPEDDSVEVLATAPPPELTMPATEHIHTGTPTSFDLPKLIEALRSNDGGQIQAAYQLAKLGPRAARAVEALVNRLQDDSAPPPPEDSFGIPVAFSKKEHRDIIHRAVLEALGNIGPDALAAVPAIRPFLGASNGFVRASAAVALWKISGQADVAVKSMVELLENGDWYGKRWSATGLGRMGPAGEAGITALIKALSDADAGVRRDAAIALGTIGPKARSAVPRLVVLVKEENGAFQADFEWALISLDAKAAAEAGVLAPDRAR
jgi:HEAT repeat protein